MYVANSARASNASVVALLLLAALLASCGGEGGSPTSPGGGGTPSGSAPPPAAVGTGSLTVTVTDPEGEPLANAIVTVFNGQQTAIVGTAESDRDGMATIKAVPGMALVSVRHPLGYCRIEVADVRQAGSTALTAIVQPASPVTAAMHPVTVVGGSPSADRAEIELQVAIVASEKARFQPSSYGSYAASQPSPYLRLDDCIVWLDALRTTPACVYESSGRVSATDFSFDPVGTPATPAARGPYSALLLLDQSRRVADYDPYDLRTLAAKHFIRRARFSTQADLVAVAGFAGQGGDASRPPLLQQLPLWAPPHAATVFSADRFAQEAAVDTLRPLVGGTAPVFDALSAAMTLTAAQAPATARRAIVALLGGGDDSGLSGSQRQAALASLRQQQLDTGIQVVLIAGRLDANSVERTNLAELAAALRAPIIYSGYPRDWRETGDGLYSALDLAADLLAGSALPSVEAVFRMKSDQPGGFQSGAALHGTLWIESDLCPMGCAELPMEFAVDIHTGVSP
jgi:hypothetical protein